jgi:hypothetical protein
MDLKLKDEITKLLIQNPGLSIGEIAKKTGNYYSYTHKIIASMEKKGLVFIEKKGNSTKIFLDKDYKFKWANEIKNLFDSLKKDAEITASIILSLLFLALNINNANSQRSSSLMVASESFDLAASQGISQKLPKDYSIILLILIPLLLIIWFIKKNRINKKKMI